MPDLESLKITPSSENISKTQLFVVIWSASSSGNLDALRLHVSSFAFQASRCSKLHVQASRPVYEYRGTPSMVRLKIDGKSQA
jgi:hypothetical protein